MVQLVRQVSNVVDLTTILQALDELDGAGRSLIQSKLDRLNPSPAAKRREKRIAGDVIEGETSTIIEEYWVPKTLASGERKRYGPYLREMSITVVNGKRKKKFLRYLGKKGA